MGKQPGSWRHLVLACAVAALAACGDDESRDLSGTAAVGAPLTGASVQLRDTKGQVRQATTDAGGAFRLAGVPDGAVMVRCEGGLAQGEANRLQLHGLVQAGSTVNCTPLTELALWKLLDGPPARAFDSFGPAHAARLSSDAIAAAEQAVLAALADGAGVDVDPAAVPRRWHDTPLAAGNPGDPHDAALDGMREAIADQPTLDLMGEMVVHGICRADDTCA
ncbi:carboxypeptidase-like regulatory domain-containing protein [Cupriavidus oxalaticus]|uniref:carboxypeptidase-like regulatory domain-containing protein n=1 Tax=Cupriavidus oxalaticus TaxID=96344 RepID=UPI00317FC7BD